MVPLSHWRSHDKFCPPCLVAYEGIALTPASTAFLTVALETFFSLAK